MDKPEIKINNPILRVLFYFILAMVLGIGSCWILLGIASPILLVLLLRHW